jgi:hypothetical protein
MKNILSLSASKISVALLVLASVATSLPAQAQTGASPLPKASPKAAPTPAAPTPAAPTPVATPAAVEAAPKAAPKAAAAGLVGQCRAMNKQTPLYKDRNTTSEAVSLLKMNDKVTLAEDAGASGLIAVSVPGKGFVLMANLKTCPGSKPPVVTPPVKPAGSCRLVVQKQGLSIRKEPGSGEVVGGVGFNEKVTLVDPAEAKTATDGRDWVKIAKPTAGWVSEGFKDQAFKNLGSCN